MDFTEPLRQLCISQTRPRESSYVQLSLLMKSNQRLLLTYIRYKFQPFNLAAQVNENERFGGSRVLLPNGHMDLELPASQADPSLVFTISNVTISENLKQYFV
jgi:hypothetical protein